MWRVVYSSHDCPILGISCIGSAKNPQCTRFGPGVRNHWIVHFIRSGRGYFNGAPVTAGQGFLITPGMAEHYFPDENDPWEYAWILSNDSRIDDLFKLLQPDERTGIFSFDHPDALRQLVDFTVTNQGKRLTGFELLEQVSRLFKYPQKANLPNAIKTNADLYLDAAQTFIASNLHRPITVSELTQFLGVSQPYLFKLFKSRVSKSPKQYISDQKLTRAIQLLEETDLSITDIAYSVGFQDVLSFSKSFRAAFGISPKHYRNQRLS